MFGGARARATSGKPPPSAAAAAPSQHRERRSSHENGGSGGGGGHGGNDSDYGWQDAQHPRGRGGQWRAPALLAAVLFVAAVLVSLRTQTAPLAKSGSPITAPAAMRGSAAVRLGYGSGSGSSGGAEEREEEDDERPRGAATPPTEAPPQKQPQPPQPPQPLFRTAPAVLLPSAEHGAGGFAPRGFACIPAGRELDWWSGARPPAAPAANGGGVAGAAAAREGAAEAEDKQRRQRQRRRRRGRRRRLWSLQQRRRLAQLEDEGDDKGGGGIAEYFGAEEQDAGGADGGKRSNSKGSSTTKDSSSSSSSKEKSSQTDGGSSPSSSPSPSTSSLAVAVVNDVEFHGEVALGITYALRSLGNRLRVYLNPAAFAPNATGAHGGLVKRLRAAVPSAQLINAYDKPAVAPADVVFLLSPEFSVDYAREFLDRARPRLTVVFIHEPGMDLGRLRYLVTGLHAFTGIAALGPRVARAVSRRLNGADVHWVLPAVPADGCGGGCVDGFAVQGKFEPSRRDYARLWRDLQTAAGGGGGNSSSGGSSGSGSGSSSGSSSSGGSESPSTLLPRVNVVGSGDVGALGLPRALKGAVRVYAGLGYDDYYDTLCRSAGLLPLFNAAAGYMRDKVSSSVLASLSAGVPLLAPPGLLEAHEFLSKDAVLPMAAGESEAAAMARLYASPDSLPGTLAAARAALARVRDALNARATATLNGLIAAAAAEGRPKLGSKKHPLRGSGN